MTVPEADRVLVRYGEIGLKSTRVQDRMEALLADNIRAALDAAGQPARVERERTRLYVYPVPAAPGPTDPAETNTGSQSGTESTGKSTARVTDETKQTDIEQLTATVANVFGVVSASPARTTPPRLAAITDALVEVAAACYDGGSFAVRARRAGGNEAHPFASTDIEKRGGDAVWSAAVEQGHEPEVDLEDPDATFYVECRPERAFVFTDKREGPGGLPVGCQEPLVALLSGGIDSPVAAYLAMKRGSPVYPLYVDLGDYGGVDHRLRAEETVASLARFAPAGLTMRVAPGGEGVDRIVETVDSCRMPVIRRFMFRIAAHVADALGAVGIVTGESIGQKSSQTATNLRATSAATTLPVHRPLLGLDKTEITELAREIGTFEESTIDAGCYRLSPDGPATRPTLAAVSRAEPDDIDELAAQAASHVEPAEPSSASSPRVTE